MAVAVTFRRAAYTDLEEILSLLADDDVSRARAAEGGGGGHDNDRVQAAFAAIDADPNQVLVVGDCDGKVIACLQITFIPGLSRAGAWRGQIEAVRVARHLRGQGIGTELMQWAITRCRERHCRLVQLMSDLRRRGAHGFYERMGFLHSHGGFKLKL